MNASDLTNKRFGSLVAIEPTTERRDGSVVWRCRCDCGKECTVNTRHLNRKNHRVRSCGCQQYKKSSEHRQWTGVGEISGTWFRAHITRENSQTARTKVPVTVTKEQLWELFLKQGRRCALTGLELTIGPHRQNNASVDRIDSSRGYEIDNIQFVHKDINMMKRWYNQDYFIKMCGMVSIYNNKEK